MKFLAFQQLTTKICSAAWPYKRKNDEHAPARPRPPATHLGLGRLGRKQEQLAYREVEQVVAPRERVAPAAWPTPPPRA
eukprot:scaffold13627_cov109-Isochrysis_galbana.AAC.1